MARPTRDTVQSGVGGWDATANNNFIKTFDRPLAIHEHAGDESDLDATYPPAAYSNCLVWVEHSATGWALWRSDGSSWAIFSAGGGGGGLAGNTPIAVACSDEVTVLDEATAVTTFRMPGSFELNRVRASLTTASSSGEVEVDVKINGSTIFTTTLTIDQSETTSETAAVAAVLIDNPTEIADDDEITVDIVAAGTGAIGLKIYLEGVMGVENLTTPDYETSEQNTGVLWIDDSPIYQKTINVGSLPNTTAASTAHGITGLAHVVKVEGYMTNGTIWRNLPSAATPSNVTDVAVDATDVLILTSANMTSYTGHVTIYYTKV